MPSPWLQVMREHVMSGALGTVHAWAEVPEKSKRDGADLDQRADWPAVADERLLDRVTQAARWVADAGPQDERKVHFDDAERELLADWDRDIDLLVRESIPQAIRHVRVPRSITTSDVMRIAADRQGYAEDLARPMPKVTSAAARRGTDFHAWVEQRWRAADGLLPLGDDEIDPTWLPDSDLQELIEAFEQGPYAERRAHDVEVPFATVVDGIPVRGRIDAVFVREDGTWEVIDWKTSLKNDADDNQLRVYRQAWAEIAGVNPTDVAAGFHYVRSAATVFLPADAAGPAGLVAGD